jgi:hypothetical protein
MKFSQITLVLSLFCAQSLIAQHNHSHLNCASDQAMAQFYFSHPEKLLAHQKFEKDIYDGVSISTRVQSPPYTLPIVVHIIHQNGAENIPDEQVELAVEQLNEAFSNTGYYGAKGDGFDTQIQFCLAKRDPNDNPTNGITRHESPLTNMVMETDDIAMKDIARWNPLDYINIYVVNEISSISSGDGVLGYAYLPTSHGMPEDGMVCEAAFMGTTPSFNSVLIHEMGHYLYLYHTFDGGCANNDCLADGDRVCDTPPDQGTLTTCVNNSCATDLDDTSSNNPLTADENDPTQNFMDYSPFNCYYAFTAGQAERMYAAIENIRSSLLESDGCESLCTIPTFIDFTASSTEVLTGETVTFTNNSIGATIYEWRVDGVPFATTEDAGFTFNNVGSFEVELFINNEDVNCAETLSLEIQVSCPAVAGFTASSLTLVEGDVFVATNNSDNATDYEWYINGVLTSTDVDLNFTFPNEGIYTVLLIASDGNCGSEISTLVTVFPLDPCPNPPCPEICDNGFDDDGDGYIDCFDDECECSSGTDCSADIPANNFDIELEWRSLEEGASSIATPMVANLDPQNGPMPEIIVQEGNNNFPNNVTTTLLIFSGDGSNLDAPVELQVDGGMAVNPVSPPVIGDIDGNGIPEVVIMCWDARLRVYTNYNPTANPPMELWMESNDPGIEQRAIPALADFNGDGVSEILVGNDVFQFDLTNPASPQLNKVLDGNGDYGKIGWAFDFPATNGSSISIASDVLSVTDCGGDPDCAGLEIVAGTNIYSVDLNPFDGDGIEIKTQRDLNMLTPGFNFIDGYTTSADINLDGTLDVIVSSSRDFEMGVYVWDKNGLIAFFPFPLPPPGELLVYVGTPAVANVYDDTADGFSQDFPEIIAVSSLRLTAFNLNEYNINPAEPYHWSIFTQDDSGYTGATIFDFNGDGTDEICYRDTEVMRIMYGGATPFPSGVSGNRNWETIPCFSPTFGEAPVVADCDADGEAELIYTGKTQEQAVLANTKTNLWVSGSGEELWVPARPVWNQYAYFGVNVNDDLTIPANQQLHQLEFPALGSGKRPFNRFMAQTPVLDEDFDPFYPVPDATIVVNDLQCEGENIRVFVTICNEGSNGLPEDMPIVFYNNDPITTGASPLTAPIELGVAIPPGGCENLELLTPAQYNAPIYVGLNVDLSLSTPYDPVVVLPVTEIVECDYTNNFTSFIELSVPLPPLDLGPDLELCGSSVITLDAGGPYDSYRWQDGTDDQTFTAFSEGKYWVTVQSGCAPPLSDTIDIIFNEFATFDLGPDLSICTGDSIVLAASGFDQYSWSPVEELGCTNCETVTAFPIEDVTYYATGQNGNCIFTDSVRITIETIALTLTADTLTCNAPTGQISVTTNVPDLNYFWSGPEGFMADTPVASVTLPGEYTLEVTNTIGGCGAIETIVVAEDTQSPIANIDTLTATVFCDETSVTLDATTSSQGNEFSYMWSPFISIANGGNTLNPQVSQAGIYFLTVTNEQNGCTATAEVDVTAEDTPQITALTIDEAGCNGEAFGRIQILDVAGGVPEYSFSLNDRPFTQSTFFGNLVAGNYTLQVVDVNDCQSEIIVEITQPEPIFVTLAGETLVELNEIVDISASVSPSDAVLSNIFWQSEELGNELMASTLIDEETLFTITVIDTAGCIASDDLIVRPARRIYFPNAFNPNSSIGDNLVFTGFGDEDVAIIRSLKIFDRWGGQVFDGINLLPNDTSVGWDGTARGKAVNQGVYLYFADVEFIDGEKKKLKGDVMLVR